MAMFGKYLHVDKVDEIFIRIRIFANIPTSAWPSLVCTLWRKELLPEQIKQVSNDDGVHPRPKTFLYVIV